MKYILVAILSTLPMMANAVVSVAHVSVAHVSVAHVSTTPTVHPSVTAHATETVTESPVVTKKPQVTVQTTKVVTPIIVNDPVSQCEKDRDKQKNCVSKLTQ